MSARAWIVSACLLALLPTRVGAQLTESEKQLLRGSISTQSAQAAGKAGDAATLERIVELGDPALVQSFGYGMRFNNANVVPPQVEAIMVRHFDHPKVGAALRALDGRYSTRALFDLHLARIKASYRSDEPSYEQILRTEQAGIDEELLAVAARFPARHGQLNGAAHLLGRRKHPGAVPLLLAAIEPLYAESGRAVYNTALDLLLGYPSEETWRKANAEVERLKREGKVRDDQYAQARGKLDATLRDPAASLARMRGNDKWDQFTERRKALADLAREANALYRTSPREYVAARVRYLEAEEALAREFREDRIDSSIAYSWGQLGIYTRFVAGDAKAALPYLERAAKGRELFSQVVLADTYQLALKDRTAALKAYERALENATRQAAQIDANTPLLAPGRVSTQFWKSWLAAEVEFLRTGKPFSGRVPEPVIVGFWDTVRDYGRMAALSFPEWGNPQQAMVAYARGAPPAPTWPSVEAELAGMERDLLATRLAQLPASRFALLATLRHVSAVPQAEAILRELRRSDPSGYWTTIALGTVAFHESSAARRDEALANGIARDMPGMAAKPNVLAAAARSHLQSRALRTVERKP